MPPAITVRNGPVALQCELVASGLLGDLRQVGFDDTVIAVPDAIQILEETLRLRPVFRLHREHRHAELVLVVFRVLFGKLLQNRRASP